MERKFHVVKCINCSWKYFVPSRYATKSCPRCGKKNDVKMRTIETHDTIAEAVKSVKGEKEDYSIKKASDLR